MTKSEITLQYIKTFTWPVVVIILVICFYPQVIQILEGDMEIEVLGVKIKGKRSSGMEELAHEAEKLNATINDLKRELVEQQQVNGKLIKENQHFMGLLDQQNKEITKVRQTRDNIEVKPVTFSRENVEKLVIENNRLNTSIRANFDVAQRIVKGDKFEEAKELEIQGFENLVNNNFRGAIENFQKAYRKYPTFRNVDEIYQLLKKFEPKLNDEATQKRAKKEVFNIILERYSWGMPGEIKKQMAEAIK